MREPMVVNLPARPDRANEDAVALGDGVAVVVDGAGLPKERRLGCSHEVAWFSRSIADAFRDGLVAGLPMTRALHDAIAAVAGSHGGCELGAGSPSGTAAAWRIDGDEAEYLVLCDASIVLVGRDGRSREITDQRIGPAVSATRDRLAAASPGLDRRELAFEALDASRNTEGGWWCAHHDPAADQALTGRVPIAELTRIVAASDGGTRGYQLVEVHSLDEFGSATADPEAVADAIRAAESRSREALEVDGTKVHDDLTLVVQQF